MYGPHQVSVERKLAMNGPPDIAADDLRYRKRANEKVRAKFGTSDGEFVPILYVYELYRGCVADNAKMGHMCAAPGGQHLREGPLMRAGSGPTSRSPASCSSTFGPTRAAATAVRRLYRDETWR